MQSGIKYCGINQSTGCSIHEQNFLTNMHLGMEFVLSNSFPEPSLASPQKKLQGWHIQITFWNYTEQTQTLPSNNGDRVIVNVVSKD